MLTLYLSPRSSSLAAHIALLEVGAPFETRVVSVARQDTRKADFLRINPEGKVPALLIDGRLLTEVAGILFYVARRFPDARLLPGDAEAEAQAVSWMSFLAATAHPAWRTGGDAALPAYRLAEQRIAPSGWAAGDDFSIADIHLFRLFWRFHAASGLDRSRFPRLFSHLDRMMERPAVTTAISIETEYQTDIEKGLR